MSGARSERRAGLGRRDEGRPGAAWRLGCDTKYDVSIRSYIPGAVLNIQTASGNSCSAHLGGELTPFLSVGVVGWLKEKWPFHIYLYPPAFNRRCIEPSLLNFWILGVKAALPRFGCIVRSDIGRMCPRWRQSFLLSVHERCQGDAAVLAHRREEGQSIADPPAPGDFEMDLSP